MEPKFNVWLEEDGKVTLSLWRVKLLSAVGETGSISSAAEVLEVPYRVAWQKINEMEERLGQKLLETQVGGREGGGSQLTPLADSLIARFDQVGREVDALVRERFRDIIESLAP